ncbi:uncharacterized protein TNCT_573341 [Trichonephila clavata]|uniref:DUF7041 domain-containing protein n=1 Tax=Trichonephila clavata TaxID=2740835 RepID=A0A8X6GIQ7_TRICU|nr:uncharacterized protein TNCT_573341 [Trichonephila clavata]
MFRNARINLRTGNSKAHERTKYNYCVAHLSPDAAMAVRDVILSPGSTNPYSKLKEEVIARCGESKSQEIRRLLAGEQLGDRKPSELFRVMQRRSESHNVADSLLLELFLQQLPPNVQSILASIQPLTAQKASEVADRILEVTPAQVSAASKYSSANSDNCSESELLKELKFLRQEVKELRRSRSFSRNRFNSRNRGKSPKPTASNLCWYHYKFAEKARKCIQPCFFPGKLERAGVAATYALPSFSCRLFVRDRNINRRNGYPKEHRRSLEGDGILKKIEENNVESRWILSHSVPHVQSLYQ